MMKKRSVRSLIKDLEADELRSLISELCKLSKQNRQFLELQLSDAGATAPERIVEEAKKKIEGQLRGRSFEPKLDLRAARKVVQDYVKVLKGSPRSAADLKLYYVEVGSGIAAEFGDLYDGFYRSMESMFISFSKELTRNPSWYDHFAGRLECLRETTHHMGWGYGDWMGDMIGALEENRRDMPTC